MIVIAFVAGVLFGAVILFWHQRKKRTKELQRISKMLESAINEQRISGFLCDEDTMIGKMEYQIIRLEEMLKSKQMTAEKNREEMQKIISEIAHQIRTPVTNIRTYTELLKEKLLEEENQSQAFSYVSAVEESERKLHFLIESFIKMSRLEQNIIQIRKEKCDLKKTICMALGQVQNMAEEKEIYFDVQLPDKLQYTHDPNWLGEAIYNVLENAVKYSDTNGKIQIRMATTEMYVKLQIRDFGIGIQEGEEQAIYQRFYRGKNVTTQSGFGIGLYLTQKIVALHGGFVLVKRMEPGLFTEINLHSC